MKLPSILLYATWMLLCSDRLALPDKEVERGESMFFQALAMVESTNNPNAYNKTEDAVGLYQVRPIYLRDVNRIVGWQAFSLDDRWNVAKSEQMILIYLGHYATKARLGHDPTYIDCARIHNGGGNGWKKTSTLEYAARFRAAWKGLQDVAE